MTCQPRSLAIGATMCFTWLACIRTPMGEQQSGTTNIAGAVAGGGTTGASGTTGGVARVGGTVGVAGAFGIGGVSGTGGPPGGNTSLSCIPACPASAICCDGSDENCDGTRLPSGDGTNTGEFVVSSDELTVTDMITGLVWQRDGSGTRAGCSGTSNLTCTWAEAKTYCASLILGGLSGWRLPSRTELRTIVDFTRSSPAIDPTAFTNTPSASYWTSSPSAGSSGRAWLVDLNRGSADDGAVSVNNRVRCVHMAPRCYPTNRFVVLTGGMVRDTLTELVWQQDGSGTRTGCSGAGNTTCAWVEAKAYCSGLSLASLSDWRLPTIKELDSIVDLTVAGPGSISQAAFPNTPANWFWTSSPYAGSSDFAWFVYFGYGSSYSIVVGDDLLVRCVR